VIARGIREGSNEIDRYYDWAINVGGPIVRDKVWWFGTYRTQFNAVAQPNFQFDQTFDTKRWNPVGKLTYQVNQSNKFIAYYQAFRHHIWPSSVLRFVTRVGHVTLIPIY